MTLKNDYPSHCGEIHVPRLSVDLSPSRLRQPRNEGRTVLRDLQPGLKVNSERVVGAKLILVLALCVCLVNSCNYSARRTINYNYPRTGARSLEAREMLKVKVVTM